MWDSETRIYWHPLDQLWSRIYTVCLNQTNRNTWWHVPLHRDHICSTPISRLEPQHSHLMISTLKLPNGIQVGNCRSETDVHVAWFSSWFDSRQGANESKHRSRRGLGTQIWNRMIDNHKVIHNTDDQWECDQSEFVVAKVKVNNCPRWVDVISNEKSLRSTLIVYGLNELESVNHRCCCSDWSWQQMEFQCAFLLPENDQKERWNHQKRPRSPLGERFQAFGNRSDWIHL